MANNWNTILLKGDLGRKYDESPPGVVTTPGHFIEKYNDSGTLKVRPQTVRNGRGRRMVAIENGLLGKTIDDTYAVGAGDCLYIEPESGEVINALLKIGENVTQGDYAVLAGDGTVMKAASGVLAQIVADSATLTSWTTLVAFSNGTVSIPANSLKAGDRIRIRGRVSFPSTNSTDTIVITIKIGSTVLLATTAVDVANDDVCLFDLKMTVRTAGATGTIVSSGTWSLGVVGTATPRTYVLNSTTLDTTAAASITVNATASVSSASNQAILRELVVEHINNGSSIYAEGLEPALLGQFEETLDLSVASAVDRIAVCII